ncbi:MAG: hypothetical protein ACK45R_10375 [Candidatus Kapaibacterium sp.]|jgi:hypothetical protein
MVRKTVIYQGKTIFYAFVSVLMLMLRPEILSAQAWKVFYEEGQKEQIAITTDCKVSPNGQVWLSSFYGGVFRLDGDTLVRYCRSTGHLFDDNVTSVAEDDSGRVWVAQHNLLLSIKNGRSTSYEEHNSPFTYLFRPKYIAFNKKRQRIVGFGDNQDRYYGCDGIFFSYSLQTQKWSVWNYNSSDSMRSILLAAKPSNSLQYAHTVDSNGVICIARQRYLIRFDSDSLRFDTLPNGINLYLDDQYLDPPVAITDQSGAVWVANSKALCRYDGRSWQVWDSTSGPFKHWQYMPFIHGISLDTGLIVGFPRNYPGFGGYDSLTMRQLGISDTVFYNLRNGTFRPLMSRPPALNFTLRGLGTSGNIYTGVDVYLFPGRYRDKNSDSCCASLILYWPNRIPTSVSEGDRADEPKDRRKKFDRSDNISVHSSGLIGLEDSFSGTMRLYNIHGQELMYEHYTETSFIPIPALLSGVYVAVFATSLGECSTKKINVYE